MKVSPARSFKGAHHLWLRCPLPDCRPCVHEKCYNLKDGLDHPAVNSLSKKIALLVAAAVLAPSIAVDAATTTPVLPPHLTRTLSHGISGGDVAELQAFLARDTSIYIGATVTGSFGPLTEAAVPQFQRTPGIVSLGSPATAGDGIVGPRTRSATAQARIDHAQEKVLTNAALPDGCQEARSSLTLVAQSKMYRVVVTLKGLEAGTAWAQRIAEASERVMLSLKNRHVEVNRVFDGLPALALTVDCEALQILRSHPDVLGVAEDGTSAPGGSMPGTAN